MRERKPPAKRVSMFIHKLRLPSSPHWLARGVRVRNTGSGRQQRPTRKHVSRPRRGVCLPLFFVHASCRPRARGPYADAATIGGHTRGHAIVRPPGSTTTTATTTIPYAAASTAPTRRRQNACRTVPGDSRTHLFKHTRRGKK